MSMVNLKYAMPVANVRLRSSHTPVLDDVKPVYGRLHAAVIKAYRNTFQVIDGHCPRIKAHLFCNHNLGSGIDAS